MMSLVSRVVGYYCTALYTHIAGLKKRNRIKQANSHR